MGHSNKTQHIWWKARKQEFVLFTVYNVLYVITCNDHTKTEL
jgi:hypothetical protein